MTLSKIWQLKTRVNINPKSWLFPPATWKGRRKRETVGRHRGTRNRGKGRGRKGEKQGQEKESL